MRGSDDQTGTVAALGRSAELQVGEWVAAIGSPFGFDNNRLLAQQKAGAPVALLVRRGDQTIYLAIEAAPARIG